MTEWGTEAYSNSSPPSQALQENNGSLFIAKQKKWDFVVFESKETTKTLQADIILHT